MTERKCVSILIILSLIFIISVSYVLVNSQLNQRPKTSYLDLYFEKYSANSTTIKVDSIKAQNYVLANCIASFLYETDVLNYLKSIPSESVDNNFYYYKSYQNRPYNYEVLGKECSASFNDGQQNDDLKKYDDSCFIPFKIDIQRPQLTKILIKLREEFNKAKLDLILIGGSFIGSYRYHSIIPYDDDIDFQILTSQKPQVRDILKKLTNDTNNHCFFKDTEETNQHWKLGILCKNSYETCQLQIDFFFMWIQNNTIEYLEYPKSLPKSTFYPLVNRPFEGVVFKTPNNFFQYLTRQYENTDANQCSFWNHQTTGPACSVKSVDCDMLRYKFPYKLTAVLNNSIVKGLQNDFFVEIIVHKLTIRGVFIRKH